MENKITEFYLIAKDLGVQLGKVPEGGPDWKVVREKAKALQELADQMIKAKAPAGG